MFYLIIAVAVVVPGGRLCIVEHEVVASALSSQLVPASRRGLVLHEAVERPEAPAAVAARVVVFVLPPALLDVGPLTTLATPPLFSLT